MNAPKAKHILISSGFVVLTGVLMVFFTNMTTFSRSDLDGDGIADSYDNCLGRYNPTQRDMNDNRIGDECDQETMALVQTVIEQYDE